MSPTNLITLNTAKTNNRNTENQYCKLQEHHSQRVKLFVL